MTYIVPWWSPSKLTCWDQCPAEFFERYVQHTPMVGTVAMDFGTAVHKGLEALYLGGDGEREFRKQWRSLAERLLENGQQPGSDLTRIGLGLIEKVAELGLVGTPERRVWMRTDDWLGAPTLGYVDLWCPSRNMIVDFKTTVGSWSQERAEKEQWQPCLYSYAYWLEYDQLPGFEYIVLNRATGSLQRFQTHRTDTQIQEAFERAALISEEVARGDWKCRCRTGADCPECGALWEHSHACFANQGPRIRLGGRAA